MWPVQSLMRIRNKPTVLCHQCYVLNSFFEISSFYGSEHLSLLWEIPKYLPSPSWWLRSQGETPGKKPRETLGQEGTMDGWDSTAGGENQRHTKSVIIRASYRAGEIFQFQQDFTTVVSITSNFTVI